MEFKHAICTPCQSANNSYIAQEPYHTSCLSDICCWKLESKLVIFSD